MGGGITFCSHTSLYRWADRQGGGQVGTQRAENTRCFQHDAGYSKDRRMDLT